MDLLSDGSSSDSDQRSRKRVRGCVTILSSEEDVPVGLFQRNVPHKRGHWAGHIRIPFHNMRNKNDTISRSITNSVGQFQRILESQGYSGTIVQHSHLHISLSKYFSLHLNFIESFVSKLTQLLSVERSTRVFIDQRPLILVNDDKTRSFWSWKVQPAAALIKIVSHVDGILHDYNQPKYYVPPVFHISLASFNGDLTDLSLAVGQRDISTPPSDDDDNQIHPSKNSKNDASEAESSDDEDNPLVVVDHVVCQFGTTKTYTISLLPSP